MISRSGTFTAAGFDVRHGNNTFISSSHTITNGGATATLRLFNATPTPPNERFTITVTNATNSSAGSHSWNIATSSDPTPVTTPSYTLTSPQTITNPSAPAPSTTAAGVGGVTYTVGFTASSTGQLVNPQTITLNAPAGTFTAAGFDVRHGNNTFISSSHTITNGGATATLRLFNATPTPPNERFTITVTNATNSSAGSHSWNIATSSDPTPVTTPSYTLGPDTTPPDTTPPDTAITG